MLAISPMGFQMDALLERDQYYREKESPSTRFQRGQIGNKILTKRTSRATELSSCRLLRMMWLNRIGTAIRLKRIKPYGLRCIPNRSTKEASTSLYLRRALSMPSRVN